MTKVNVLIVGVSQDIPLAQLTDIIKCAVADNPQFEIEVITDPLIWSSPTIVFFDVFTALGAPLLCSFLGKVPYNQPSALLIEDCTSLDGPPLLNTALDIDTPFSEKLTNTENGTFRAAIIKRSTFLKLISKGIPNHYSVTA